jgi:DNA-binding NarL/FixJ family response regulator
MVRNDHKQRLGAVLIADDHAVFRFGLGSVITAHFGASRIIEAGHFDEALAALADAELGLAIFDLRMPGLARAGELAAVRRRRPDVRLVVLSGSEARQDILAALDAGVHGYIIKSIRTELLIKRLQYILSGEIYVPPLIAEVPRERTAEPQTGASNCQAQLTDRQIDVLKLLVDGRSNKQIALALKLAEGTVKMHVATLLRTINADNRTHAAAIGKQVLGQSGATGAAAPGSNSVKD